MAEPTENLQIEIDGKCYALNKVPDENSAVVLAAQEKLRKSVDLPALVEDLQRVGRFIRVAYNGVGAAGPKYTENQIEIQRLGYDITKLCDKSALTVARFEEATSCVLVDLQSTYNYLLDDLEEMALHTLSSVSKIAEDMQKAALELKTEFEEEEKEVVKILEKTQMARKDSQLHVEEQKSKLIELEEKKGKELQLIEEYQEKEREVETRRRDLEYQEDKAVSKIGDINPVKEVVYWFTGMIPFVGKVFSTDCAEKRAEAFRKSRIEALEAEQAMRNIRHEALARMASFTAKIKQSEKEQDLAKIAVDALYQAVGALKDLSVVMGKAAYFWGIMHIHCRQLAEPKVQLLIASKDKRLKVWTSNSFKSEAIRLFARWVALKGVCGIYMKQIKLTQEELYRYIAENPTREQSRKNLRDLAESFESDLKRHQNALSEKDFKAQEEKKCLDIGAELIGQESISITNSGKQFYWNGYGLNILVPENALHSGVERCVLHISASLPASFEVPNSYELVSATYNFKCEPEFVFKQAITIEMEHCADLAVSSGLIFARVSGTTNSMGELPNGDFPSDKRFGSVQVTHFSWFGIFQDLRLLFWRQRELRYCAMLFYKICSSFEVHIELAVCQDLQLHVMAVKKDYNERHYQNGPLESIRFDTSFELQAQDTSILSESQGQWNITYLNPPTFYKERVDYWSDKFRSTHSGGVIPSIQLKATLDGDSVCDLSQKLILEGVIGENNWLQVSITKRDISGEQILNETDYCQPDYSHAHETLIKCCEHLNHALSQDPLAVANALFEVGLIPRVTLRETAELNETKSEKGSRLYGEVLDVVQHTPKRYDDLLHILKRNRLLYGACLDKMHMYMQLQTHSTS